MDSDLEKLTTENHGYHLVDGHDASNLLDDNQLHFIGGTPTTNGNPSSKMINTLFDELLSGRKETDRYIISKNNDPSMKNDIEQLKEIELYRPLRISDFASNYIYDKKLKKIIKYW